MEDLPSSPNPLLASLPEFRNQLISWFSENGKDLPWRRTQDPWPILVSEIMLQQTTVASVTANRRFEKFLETFPTISSIAKAPEEAILRAWEGLGYYNRVRNLQKTAQAVLSDHSGTFPQDASELRQLPGIGPYTAGAVSSFAFNRPAPIVDGNVARVLSRLFDFTTPIDTSAGTKQLWAWADQVLDRTRPRLFNSALMELGQTICSPRKPACLTCPVTSFCQAQQPEKLPLKKPRKKFVHVEEHALLVLKEDKILLAKPEHTRRKGFWHLPLRPPEQCSHLEARSQHRYTITHHRVTLHLYLDKDLPPLSTEKFHPLATLENLPIASPIRKILQTEL